MGTKLRKKKIEEATAVVNILRSLGNIEGGLTFEEFQQRLLLNIAEKIVEDIPRGADVKKLRLRNISHSTIVFHIEREETDLEFEGRVRQAELRKELAAAAKVRRAEKARLKKEEQERKLYEDLKAKFESANI